MIQNWRDGSKVKGVRKKKKSVATQNVQVYQYTPTHTNTYTLMAPSATKQNYHNNV